MRRIWWRVSCLLVLLSLAACASGNAGAVRGLSAGEASGLTANEGIVFGRIGIIDDGVRRFNAPTLSIAPPPVNVEIGVPDGNRIGRMPLEKGGVFYWVVPREGFNISRVLYQTTAMVEPQMAIRVPPEAQACYVGTLLMDIKTKYDYSGFIYVETVNSISVLDEFEEEKARFIARYPGYPGNIQKCLMQRDAAIPVEPPSDNHGFFGSIWGNALIFILLGSLFAH